MFVDLASHDYRLSSADCLMVDMLSPCLNADYLVTKCGVLMMSLFVFFTTTMSVSFTVRETQTRMLKFTGFFAFRSKFFQHNVYVNY